MKGEMEYTLLGETGKVSRICLGTMTFGYVLGEKEQRPLSVSSREARGLSLLDGADPQEES
jgi:aryl-alcohol dehydrogenase-like predicted oxidoreductase